MDIGVRQWFDAVRSDGIYMSVITDLELERGMLLQSRRDPAQSAALAAWVGSVRTGVAGRVLDVTVEIAVVCGDSGTRSPATRRRTDRRDGAASRNRGGDTQREGFRGARVDCDQSVLGMTGFIGLNSARAKGQWMLRRAGVRCWGTRPWW